MYEANILLVDDETAILQLLTTILEKKVFLILQLQHQLKWLFSHSTKRLRFNYFRCHASWTIWF